MRRRLLAFVLFASAAIAQPAIAPPLAGTVRDSSGNLHTVIGVAGNFVVIDSGISNVLSAAFSGSAGLVKTGSELLVLDATGQIAARYDAPGSGRALFAFDASGAPALAYYSGALFRFDNNELKPIDWTGEAVSIALAGPQSASAIVRRNGQLWNVRLTLSTGDIQNETAIGDVVGPLLLLPDGRLLFTRDSSIVVRESSGVERLVPAGFEIDFFEQMGRDWIAVRESAGGRLFALRITPQDLSLYQIPEVTQ